MSAPVYSMFTQPRRARKYGADQPSPAPARVKDAHLRRRFRVRQEHNPRAVQVDVIGSPLFRHSSIRDHEFGRGDLTRAGKCLCVCSKKNNGVGGRRQGDRIEHTIRVATWLLLSLLFVCLTEDKQDHSEHNNQHVTQCRTENRGNKGSNDKHSWDPFEPRSSNRLRSS